MDKPFSLSEQRRKSRVEAVSQDHKEVFGQFLTSADIADFMVSLFFFDEMPADIRLLDPGFGLGVLSSTFIARHQKQSSNIHVTGYEIDHTILSEAQEIISGLSNETTKIDLIRKDFILESVDAISCGEQPGFTHVVMNPPYKKIRTDSDEKVLLKAIGIDSTNLYSAFVSLALKRLAPGGQLVAIIPRSFCNGMYFRHFRNQILEESAIRAIHIFRSRNKAFRDEKVLQENVIISLVRKGKQESVSITSSDGPDFAGITGHQVPFDSIVIPDDPERIFHIPEPNVVSDLWPASFGTLSGIGIQVSTGPVVAFREKQLLSDQMQTGTIPLINANNVNDGWVSWPSVKPERPEHIFVSKLNPKHVFRKGNYCVLRRFSAKEDKRRIVAAYLPEAQIPIDRIGFENKTNVFHLSKSGLEPEIAAGLTIYLNSTFVDKQFRKFNGNTQVNVTDLKALKYPPSGQIRQLGKWALSNKNASQTAVDMIVGEIINGG